MFAQHAPIGHQPVQIGRTVRPGQPFAIREVARLDPQRSPPDAFSIRGREIYLHFPNGAGRSKLTIDYFERLLAVRATARNWNTLTRLLAMTQGPPDGGE